MARRNSISVLESDPQWYKDAIIYELHVRSFADSDGDGVGDFRGLAGKVDYLQDLGVTAVWLLPFYPSPLKDDGYDIADYTQVHQSYGNLKDFRHFLREAHGRGLRVITELVLNHTSDEHPWFQRARRAKAGSPERDFYVWSDDPERYKDARIIFKDFEHSNWAWDHVAKAYYWHRFYSHQPDLNWDNPRVRRTMMRTVDYWLGDLGVDGLRLDAVPYLFEREGTHCENLPDTHAALKELRRHIDGKYKDRMLLAEANQWPEDAVAYFGGGRGDECHAAFHFPIMPRLFMSVRTEDRYPVVDMMEQTPAIPEDCQWVLFLRNHDELTLEMVTDEERDYMYRVYAQDSRARINLGIRRRLAPLLRNRRAKIQLMNGLLLSLPGTPVIYYGDEIGMGDNFYLGDRNGVRTPMQWSPDRNAGFSDANSQQLYLPVIIDPEYHYEAINVEVQQNNPESLLWWMKRLLAMRKRYKAFGRGTISFLYPDNPRVLAFVRSYEGENILVVANLSRFAQHVELDLTPFKDHLPRELFGRSRFPIVGETPYPLSLGPHSLFWFVLEPERRALEAAGGTPAELPSLRAASRWDDVLWDRRALPSVLPRYLSGRRWFGAKARTIQAATVTESVPLTPAEALCLVNVEYAEGEPDTYLLPLAARPSRPDDAAAPPAQAVLANVQVQDRRRTELLYEAVWDRGFGQRLLSFVLRQGTLKGRAGELEAWSTREVRQAHAGGEPLPPATVMTAEQSNTSIRYGNRYILKLIRRVEDGMNPDLEIGRFLTDHGFRNSPPILGAIDYRRSRSHAMTVAILQGFVPNEGDAWNFTMHHLAAYFEQAMADRSAPPEAANTEGLIAGARRTVPERVKEMMGSYLPSAQTMGQRTAELHRVLASDAEDPAFAPEPFGMLYQRSLIQSMRNLTRQSLQLLRRRLRDLPDDAREDAQRVLGLEGELLRRTRTTFERRISAVRTRLHGDLHLGQMLNTGKDFVIIDFEGEPARALSERRIKRSPLRDVAGMIRSFQYAGQSALLKRVAGGQVRREDAAALAPWVRAWESWASAAFLGSYLETAAGAAHIPPSREELGRMLDAYLIEKALYELGYELNNRPDWVHIPLRGIRQLMGVE
jgi:maltose alpha-D-glucosyltransferase/alpha-amylase